MSRIEKISIILNDLRIYDLISEAVGVKIDNDSEIFREIEEYILEQYDEMDDNRAPATCRACNEIVDESSIFCSYECSKIDTE
tara:strand:- start:684 stop:932 length:249 start_codon:yes stop_codon:yes gene_type:complete